MPRTIRPAPCGPVFERSASVAECAYLAGLIDGEGCICVVRWRNKAGGTQYQLRLRITNTNRTVLEWVAERFGGQIHADRTHPAMWKPKFVWDVSSRTASRILELVSPYMIIKREKARLALEFQRHVDGSDDLFCRTQEADLAWRETHKQRISAA